MEFIVEDIAQSSAGPIITPVDFKREIESLSHRSSTEKSNDQSHILAELKKARVDPNVDPPISPLIASIGDAPFATLGNFSCIIGKAKAKKTFFVSLVIAAFLKEKIGPIQAFKPKGKGRIVLFDTEQSREHVTKVYRRILKLGDGSDFYDIEVYDLRPYSPRERLELIDYVLRVQNPQSDISFVVIDGIRDLITDINSPDQATEITTWLMKVTADMSLHICTILHQNKGDNNARGHLGTEIINKSSAVLSVTKDSDSVSSVKAEFCRDKEPAPFAFTVDEVSGLPMILEGYVVVASEHKSKDSGKSSISDEKHKKLMSEVFDIEDKYSYGELCIQVGIKYGEAGIPISQSKAKRIIRYCVNEGIIEKDGAPGSNGKYIITPQDE